MKKIAHDGSTRWLGSHPSALVPTGDVGRRRNLGHSSVYVTPTLPAVRKKQMMGFFAGIEWARIAPTSRHDRRRDTRECDRRRT